MEILEFLTFKTVWKWLKWLVGSGIALQGQWQERQKNAIEHFGHESVRMRLAGAHELVQLAKDNEESCKMALDAICDHVRGKTGEDGYQEKYKAKPSVEVQRLLALLFVQDYQVFKGLPANLQGSFLNGADLNKAHLEGADLRGAHLEGADLRGAHLQRADLRETHLQGADLMGAHLQGADLMRAHLQGARLAWARLQGAGLNGAHLPMADLRWACLQRAGLGGARLQGAGLNGAYLQGARLHWAYLQGVTLSDAHLEGAGLNGAHLEGADLSRAHLEGADLSGAHLQAATLSYANLRGAGKYSVRIPLNELDVIIKKLDAINKIFAERMNALIGRESDVSGVVFEGGLSREDVDSLVKGLSDEKANELRSKLDPHVDRPKIKGVLPKNCGAKLGAYSKEEAEQWIAEYNKAMSEVPEEPKKQ